MRSATSMNRCADLLATDRQATGISLEAQAVKDCQYGVVAGVLEAPAGQVFRQFQFGVYRFDCAAQVGADHFLFSLVVVVGPFCRPAAFFAIVVSRYVPAPLTAPAPHKNSISLLPLLINWPFGLITCVSRLRNPMTALCNRQQQINTLGE